MKVYRTNKLQEFYTDERCFITEILNNEENRDISMAKARVAPGQTTQRHSLKGIEEIYYVLQGQGIVTIDDQSEHLTQGDCVIIPKDIPQFIENTGDQFLEFLCICRPAFEIEKYKVLGE